MCVFVSDVVVCVTEMLCIVHGGFGGLYMCSVHVALYVFIYFMCDVCVD